MTPIYLVFIVFIASFSVQMVYFWLVFGRLAFYRKKAAADRTLFRPVSVVISAKNEYENLKENLPLILQQDYPDFEVVVVDDCSDDETEFLLKKLTEEYSNLNVVRILNNVNFFSGKKFPLSMGIKSARNPIVLLTDADCKPATKDWIFNMQSNFPAVSRGKGNEGGVEIVLGYGAYVRKKGLLNLLQRYDTLRIGMEYFSLALAGFPYMGVGRNLSYTKEIFYRNKGFTAHYSLKSGDDDLFISSAADSRNTSIEIGPESHTLSEPKPTFASWIKQKMRHQTTARHYKAKHKLLLGTYVATQLAFFISLGILLCNTYELIIIISLLSVRLSSQLIINKLCINKLGEKNLLLFSPLFELIMLLVNVYITVSNVFSRPKKW